MQEYERQSGDDISNTIVLGGCALPLARRLSSRTPTPELKNVFEYDLVAAEVRTVAMARTTCSGPTPMDLGILAKEAVCHVCGKGGYFAKDCWQGE